MSLDLRCIGMEFATEMLIKSSLRRARIAEVPITLHPDGRTAHPPHLKTFRDGWRTLRFYLMYSPRWLYVLPGLVLGMLGLIGYAIAMPQLRIHGMRFDVHTLLFASLAIIAGYQSMAVTRYPRRAKCSSSQPGPHPRSSRCEPGGTIAWTRDLARARMSHNVGLSAFDRS